MLWARDLDLHVRHPILGLEADPQKVMIDLHGAPGGQNGFDNS